jgi:hypothetical protein
MGDWKRVHINKDKKIYKLLLPYYDFDFRKVCDKLCEYVYDSKYRDNCIRLFVYLVRTCGYTKEIIVDGEVKQTKGFVFNCMLDGRELLSLAGGLLMDKETKKHMNKLFAGIDKGIIYKNTIIKGLNTVIKKECGIDIIKLYSKRKQILLDFEYGRDKYIYKLVKNNGKWICKKVLNPNRRKPCKKVMI